MNDSSFAELYRRSRYYSRPPHPGEKTDKAEKAEMQRLEEFAVAATAFVLRHDTNGVFRNAFLRRVCRLSHLAGEQFEIGVQTDHQKRSGKFDLTLMLPGNSAGRCADVDKKFCRHAKHLAQVIPVNEHWRFGR